MHLLWICLQTGLLLFSATPTLQPRFTAHLHQEHDKGADYLVVTVEEEFKEGFSRDGILELTTRTGRVHLPLLREKVRFWVDAQGEQQISFDLYYSWDRASFLLEQGAYSVAVFTNEQKLTYAMKGKHTPVKLTAELVRLH
jgi:hypothetical protein